MGSVLSVILVLVVLLLLFVLILYLLLLLHLSLELLRLLLLDEAVELLGHLLRRVEYGLSVLAILEGVVVRVHQQKVEVWLRIHVPCHVLDLVEVVVVVVSLIFHRRSLWIRCCECSERLIVFIAIYVLIVDRELLQGFFLIWIVLN